MTPDIRIRHLGIEDYGPVWREMQRFTAERDAATPDELWVLEHPPVYTLGLNGSREHLLGPLDAPLVASDRGGQVTYHGPGQLIIYALIDLSRRNLGVRALVSSLEGAVLGLLAQYGLPGETRRTAPGVYVEGRKIASLGLRIRRGCSYHGIALNVDLDLTPFAAINPCGHAGLEVTSLARLGIPVRCRETAAPLLMQLIQQFDAPEGVP